MEAFPAFQDSDVIGLDAAWASGFFKALQVIRKCIQGWEPLLPYISKITLYFNQF